MCASIKRILIGCSVWACSYDVFDLGDYSSPDLPCGQKDWRKVKNEAEVHQARPNCHCQVRKQPRYLDDATGAATTAQCVHWAVYLPRNRTK